MTVHSDDPAVIGEIQGDLWRCGLEVACGPIDGDYGPRTTEAVRRFQEAWTYDRLTIDGDCGPATRPALRRCADMDGAVSDHFALPEFASRGNGDVRLLRELVDGLEALRALTGAGLQVVSGYRDPDHNAAVGGASGSMHLYGAAADVPPRHDLDTVRELEVFGGIGYVADSGLVVHVDVRHFVLPGGVDPATPETWTY